MGFALPPMKFYEYKAHEIFRKYGIPVPRGLLAAKPEDLVDAPLPCAVKAQVLIGGGGKAGGIKFAERAAGGPAAARPTLAMSVGPDPVKPGAAQAVLAIRGGLDLCT